MAGVVVWDGKGRMMVWDGYGEIWRCAYLGVNLRAARAQWSTAGYYAGRVGVIVIETRCERPSGAYYMGSQSLVDYCIGTVVPCEKPHLHYPALLPHPTLSRSAFLLPRQTRQARLLTI